jgi:DNA invertase Pin-like site-specific DNA recombinase
MEIQIRAMFAEHEADAIAKRTSDQLQAIKTKIARGETHISKRGRLVTRLGGPDIAKAQEASRVVRSDKADEFAAKMLPVIEAIQARGHSSLRAISADKEREQLAAERVC